MRVRLITSDGDGSVVYLVEDLTQDDITPPDEAFIRFAKESGFGYVNRYTAGEFSRNLLSQLRGLASASG